MSQQDPNKEYALGTGDAEIVRLGIQHKIWSADAFAAWERAGIRAGQTVLDIGCGPGYTTADLAGLVTASGKVVAIDESARFIEHLKERPRGIGAVIDAHVGDVQHLDLPPESFDAAYQRWVLCFVKDPESVVRGVARALKPGGVFVSQDYTHYEGVQLAPPSDAFRRFMTVVAEAWRGHGGDTEISLRLPTWLERHGLTPVEILPLHRVARPGSQLWTWPTIFIDTYAPKLVEEGRLTPAEHRALVEDWKAHASDPAAAAICVTSTAMAAEPFAASALPPLNPNHPTQSSEAPLTVMVRLCGSIGVSGKPLRLPITSAATSAATPAFTCTTAPPAKSLKPSAASQPPPQTQCVTGR